MPGTAQGMGIDPTDPRRSTPPRAWTRRTQQVRHVRQDAGRVQRGGGAVDKYGGVPPFEETQRYVSNIMSRAEARHQPPGAGRPGRRRRGGQHQSAGHRGHQPVRQSAVDQRRGVRRLRASCRSALRERLRAQPHPEEATDLAAQVGWTPGQGMAACLQRKL
jgi:hypothetical protein